MREPRPISADGSNGVLDSGFAGWPGWQGNQGGGNGLRHQTQTASDGQSKRASTIPKEIRCYWRCGSRAADVVAGRKS
jgi:hypothetical protein